MPSVETLHRDHQGHDPRTATETTPDQSHGTEALNIFYHETDERAVQDKKRLAAAAEAEISEVNLVLSRFVK